MLETQKKTQGKVTTRLFVGCAVTSELKMYLSQSIKWKHVNILATKNPEDLSIIHHHGKDYIGLYAQHDKITVAELEEIEKIIKQQIQIYCPQIEIQKVNSVVFPQLFIA